MSKVEDLISKMNISKRNPTKEELGDIIKETLMLLNEINEDYKKIYEGTEENPAILKNIEEKYEKIKKDYDYLFLVDEKGVTKSDNLHRKVDEIKEFHKELLEDTEDETSIKNYILESQKYINDFYNFLFNKEDGETETKEEKVKKCIEKIEKFYNDLSNSEDGIEKEIEKIYNALTQKYFDLFNSEEGSLSKIAELDKNIKDINTFNKFLEEDIKVVLDNKQEYLKEVERDINTKRDDIKSLLSNATLGALTQGYQEAKEEYSKKEAIKLKDWDGNKLYGFFEVSAHNIGRHFPDIINYGLFIVPLVLVSLIFTGIGIEDIIKQDSNNSLLSMVDFEFSFAKFLFSFPLFWISWFGQKNISQRKRLSEEYNHKLRVVQMYRMFSDNDKSYNIDNKIKLEKILLEVIEKNPAKQLGKGETMIDQFLEKFRIKGLYKKLKDEIIKEIADLNKTTSKDVDKE